METLVVLQTASEENALPLVTLLTTVSLTPKYSNGGDTDFAFSRDCSAWKEKEIWEITTTLDISYFDSRKKVMESLSPPTPTTSYAQSWLPGQSGTACWYRLTWCLSFEINPALDLYQSLPLPQALLLLSLLQPLLQHQHPINKSHQSNTLLLCLSLQW